MNPVRVTAHRAQLNSQKRGRAQQLGNNNCESRTQDYCEISQSQIAEMTPVQVADCLYQCNSIEHSRSQQLGNEKCESRPQDESVRVASPKNTERALFDLLNSRNQRTLQNTQYQSTAGIYS